MKRTRISVLLVIALLLQLYAPLTAGAADFTPNPQTEYAKRFIAACDGQTWFINEMGVRTKSWTMPIGRVFVYTPAD